jgi:hypothetical protein
MTPWEFDLQQSVTIKEYRLDGVIVGRAEYTDAPNSYLVQWATTGMVNEKWYAPDEIVAVVNS